MYAAKELTKLAKQEFESDEWLVRKESARRPDVIADIKPLSQEVTRTRETRAAARDKIEPLITSAFKDSDIKIFVYDLS